MKASEAGGNTNVQFEQVRHQGRAKYRKVFDGRKQRIRGLWKRGESFYAQLTVEDASSGKKVVRRVRLEDGEGAPVASVPEAVKAMHRLQVRREKEVTLKLDPKRTPTFAEYADSYLRHFELVKDAKRPATLRVERVCINRWKEHLGATRLRAITRKMVNDFMAKRQSQGVSGRTVNLEHVVLRNVLKKAVEDGFLSSLPIEGVRWLKYVPARRELLRHEEIESVCAKAIKASPITGQQAADFVKLMAYSGSNSQYGIFRGGSRMLLPPDGLIIRAICDNILTSNSKIGDPKSKMRTAATRVAGCQRPFASGGPTRTSAAARYASAPTGWPRTTRAVPSTSIHNSRRTWRTCSDGASRTASFSSRSSNAAMRTSTRSLST